jgi:signal transduction histidine kinase
MENEMLKPRKGDIRVARLFILSSVLLAVVLAVLSMPVQASVQADGRIPIRLTDAEKEWLERHPRIRVGTLEAWPPLNYIDRNGTPQGIGVEYLTAINKRLNGALVAVPGPFEQNCARVLDGRLDALMDITQRTDREALFSFTRPYIVISHVIVGRTGGGYFKNERDLAGKTIALERGFHNVTYFRKNYPDVTVREYGSTAEALDAVSRGEADAYAGNRAVAIHIIEKELLNNLRLMGKLTEPKSILQIGVKKDQTLLASILNKALASLTVEEEAAIRRTWLQEVGTGLELTSEEQAWLKEHPTIRVALDPAWAPIEYLDEHGIQQGISADYLKKIGDMLGVRFDVAKGRDWPSLVAGVQHRRLDMFSSLLRTEERETYLRFTDSYLSLPVGIFTLQETQYISSMNELRGKKVAVITGHAVESTLKSEYPELLLVPSSSVTDALHKLARGEVHALVDSTLSTGCYLRELGLENIKLAGETPFRYDLSMAVRKDWPELVPILNKALRAIPEPERTDIYNKWTAPRQYRTIDYVLIAKIVAGALVIVALFVFWNRRLGREVAIRKRAEQQLQESRRDLLQSLEELNLKKKELEAANDKLKDLDRLKSMFIASMSHELRTPLNSIIGFTGIILQGMTGEINEEQRDQLQRVYKAGKHLLALITDVIDISKIEAGKIDAYVEEFELEDVVKDALSELKLDIREKGLEIETHMVPITLRTDRKRLFQCVLNFLSNAVKYTERGKITVSAEEQGDNMRLSVTDTGIGIREEDLPSLFQSFIRLDSHLKMTVSGTGLGLYLTKKIVTEMLDGAVSASSKLGEGSVFMLTIPKDLRKKQEEDTLPA